MNAKISRRVSKIPVVLTYLEPNFSWESLYVDSNVNDRYIRLVIAPVLMSRNICSGATPDKMTYLCMIRVLSEVIIAVVSSMILMVSKLRSRIVVGLIFDSVFSGRISSVHRLVKRSLSTVVVVAWAICRSKILVFLVPFSTPSWPIEDSREPSVRPSNILLGSIYERIFLKLFFKST